MAGRDCVPHADRRTLALEVLRERPVEVVWLVPEERPFTMPIPTARVVTVATRNATTAWGSRQRSNFKLFGLIDRSHSKDEQPHRFVKNRSCQSHTLFSPAHDLWNIQF
jgi:hypothetical protein